MRDESVTTAIPAVIVGLAAAEHLPLVVGGVVLLAGSAAGLIEVRR